MATLFSFVADDPIVTTYLTTTERGQVTRWQTTTGWSFEFHTGHTTGYPVYVRPDGNRDTGNLPKMDTKNKGAYHYTALVDFANGNKLRKQLGTGQATDLLAVIAASFATLALLAQRFYDNELPTPTVQPVIVATKTCPSCATAMPFKSKGTKTQCPGCYGFF